MSIGTIPGAPVNSSLRSLPAPPGSPPADGGPASPVVDPWIYRILALGLVGTFVFVSAALTGLTVVLAVKDSQNSNLSQILPMVGALGTSVLGILAALLAPSPLQPSGR